MSLCYLVRLFIFMCYVISYVFDKVIHTTQLVRIQSWVSFIIYMEGLKDYCVHLPSSEWKNPSLDRLALTILNRILALKGVKRSMKCKECSYEVRIILLFWVSYPSRITLSLPLALTGRFQRFRQETLSVVVPGMGELKWVLSLLVAHLPGHW